MHESSATLRRLQELIDASVATAGPAIARNFVGGGWAMSAEEFVDFWGEGRMAAISTVSAKGAVHTAPLDPKLVDGRFFIPTFANSQRLADHRANPRCSIASWDGPYRAVIVYGNARVVERDPTARSAEVVEEQGLAPGGVVTVEVTPTRIYAIRPPAGHHAAG
jgi:hypothetical protein